MTHDRSPGPPPANMDTDAGDRERQEALRKVALAWGLDLHYQGLPIFFGRIQGL